MKDIIEDYKSENFTTNEWIMGAIGTTVLILLCGIV